LCKFTHPFLFVLDFRPTTVARLDSTPWMSLDSFPFFIFALVQVGAFQGYLSSFKVKTLQPNFFSRFYLWNSIGANVAFFYYSFLLFFFLYYRKIKTVFPPDPPQVDFLNFSFFPSTLGLFTIPPVTVLSDAVHSNLIPLRKPERKSSPPSNAVRPGHGPRPVSLSCFFPSCFLLCITKPPLKKRSVVPTHISSGPMPRQLFPLPQDRMRVSLLRPDVVMVPAGFVFLPFFCVAD